MSLLKKFLFKFQCAPSTPWIDWLRQQYGWNDRKYFGDDRPDVTPIWRDIMAELSSFRAETKVAIGNGAMTAFWLDLWCGSQTLAEAFPALFSHSTSAVHLLNSFFRFGLASLVLPVMNYLSYNPLYLLLFLMKIPRT